MLSCDGIDAILHVPDNYAGFRSFVYKSHHREIHTHMYNMYVYSFVNCMCIHCMCMKCSYGASKPVLYYCVLSSCNHFLGTSNKVVGNEQPGQHFAHAITWYCPGCVLQLYCMCT